MAQLRGFQQNLGEALLEGSPGEERDDSQQFERRLKREAKETSLMRQMAGSSV